MAEMQTGIVAILDVLGVKGIWARESPEKIVKRWNDVIGNFINWKKYHNENKTSIGVAKLISFSDTIIITYVGGGEKKLDLLKSMGSNLSIPFCAALLEGVFCRGVVSKGEFIQNEKMIIGPAIDEAMSWFERHDWIGVSLTPSASFLLDEHVNEGSETGWFTQYNVPVKQSISSNNNVDKNTWVLKWPLALKVLCDSRHIDRDPKSELLNAFGKAPIDPIAISKYKNTIKFYDHIMAK